MVAYLPNTIHKVVCRCIDIAQLYIEQYNQRVATVASYIAI